MTSTALTVDRLSKFYRIGPLQDRHNTLRDALAAGLRGQLDRLQRLGSELRAVTPDGIWSLREVSFEVHDGDALGIIGRNGAGKSTLLKILSRITEPTSGRAIVHGRVGSLLEVGTGFHPELTGRENIYLNGAILGMRRAEIGLKFDEIVAFAGIERFLDTPIKRYSSGMYVRLAFAVAAHLQPEILLVDEVLAVGDAEFQSKCLGKMSDVASEGRTVLFVSHNMSAIQRLCPQAIWLEQGRLALLGRSADVVARYLSSSVSDTMPGSWIDTTQSPRRGAGGARFAAVWYGSPQGMGYQPFSGGPLDVVLAIDSNSARSVGSIAVTLYDEYGTKLVNADTVSLGRSIQLRQGRNQVHIRIDELCLNAGRYVLGLWMADPGAGPLDHIESACTLRVVASEAQGLGVRPNSDGLVTCRFEVVAGG